MRARLCMFVCIPYWLCWQVNDPRAPEWAATLAHHEKWWEEIWDAQAAAGVEVSTLTPEHGPAAYQPTVPYTRVPLTDIGEVNHWIALRLVKKFEEKFGAGTASPVKATA